MSKLKTDSDNNSYYVYNAVVDGKITTVKVSYDATTLDAGVETNRVYQNVKYNNKGTIATGGAEVTGYDVVENNTTGIWKLSGEYTIGLHSNTTASASTRYTVASDAKMYLIDTDGVITKVDDVKEFRAGFLERERGFHGVFPVDGDVAGLSLAEADAAAVLDVYSRKYDHSLNHSSMFRNNRAPMAPDFSGWNWRPMTFPFPTIAGMGTP